MRFYLTSRQRAVEPAACATAALVAAFRASPVSILLLLAGLWWFVASSRWFTGLREDGVVLNRFTRRVLPWEAVREVAVEGPTGARTAVLSTTDGRRVRLVALVDSRLRPRRTFDADVAAVQGYAAAHRAEA